MFQQVRRVRLERVQPLRLPPRELLPAEPAQFPSEVIHTELQRAFRKEGSFAFAVGMRTPGYDSLGEEAKAAILVGEHPHPLNTP